MANTLHYENRIATLVTSASKLAGEMLTTLPSFNLNLSEHRELVAEWAANIVLKIEDEIDKANKS